jgi:hypothetical protein
VRLDQIQRGGVLAPDLDQQLTQLDELLGLLDAGALRGAQETLENQIAELSERMEVTRQALAQAQVQRRRLARARLLLEETTHEHNGNGDPALHAAPVPEETSPAEPEETSAATPGQSRAPLAATAPFVAERRQSGERREIETRRSNGERRQSEDRRKGQNLPPAS